MSVIPYLIVHDAAAAIEFYKSAFRAIEFVRLADSSGKVMHSEIRIGDSQIMVADEFPEMGYRSPKTLGGSPVSVLLYVEDVDRVFRSAIIAGGIETVPVQDQFDGDRRGTLTDPSKLRGTPARTVLRLAVRGIAGEVTISRPTRLVIFR
jgi:PhnB protein